MGRAIKTLPLIAAALIATPVSAQPPVKLLPLGDSITQGHRIQQSYRYPLWQTLIDAGIEVDFIGSQRNAYDGNPEWPDYRGRAFDRDHQGHWGWRIDQILNGHPNNSAGKLSDWLQGYTPDIVLLHLGSNDAAQGHDSASTVAELGQVIRLLQADNPRVTILLAKVIPFGNPRVAPAIHALNAAIDGVAREHATARSRIIVVDQHTGFDTQTDTYDGIHPNASGASKMARRWLRALLANAELGNSGPDK